LTNNNQKISWFASIAVIVIILDQWSKYVIRTSPELHREILIDGWLQFNFTKNPGMAMGISFADTWVISLISIAASIAILFYTFKVMPRAKLAFMVCMGLIIGGAFGNILDRIFMARVGGYGGVLDGHVVDFIHFNLRIGSWDVFPYIFNVADMAISVAIVTLLIFSKWLIPPDRPKMQVDPDDESTFESEKKDENTSSDLTNVEKPIRLNGNQISKN